MNRVARWVLAAIVSTFASSGASAAKTGPASVSLESMVREFQLGNGLTILVVESHDSPTIGLATCFRVGAAEERPGVNGVTHILEHMLFKGTTEIGTKDWAQEKPHLDRIEEITQEVKRESAKGIRADSTRIEALLAERGREMEAANEFVVDNELMGIYSEVGAVGLNAFTSYDVTAYVLALPSNRLELWMGLESARLRRPVLRQFYTEIENILEERRLRIDTDPQGMLQEAFLAVAYDAHWYGYPILGYPSDIRSVTAAETEEWFRRYYAPNQVTLAVVGDVVPAEVQALAQKYFGDLPEQPSPEPLETFDLPKAGERRITVEYDAEPRLLLGWHKANAPSPEDAALRVVAELLTGGSSGRLTKGLVEERQLAASVQCDHEFPGSRWPNLFLIEALPRSPHTTKELEAGIWQEIERLQREPIEDRELQKVKNRIKGGFVRDLESNFGLAVALAVSQASFQDWRVLLQAQKAVEAVTTEDVRRAARDTFRKSRTIVGTLEKPAHEIDPALEEEGRRIVDRMVGALGGRERLKALRGAETKARVAITTPSGSMSAESRNAIAIPDRLLGELTMFGQTVKQCATPGGAWRTQQGSVVDVGAEEAIGLHADLEREVFLLAFPQASSLYSIESRAGSVLPSVEVRGPSGRPFVVTFEKKSGLPASVSYESDHPFSGASAKFMETFDDWREVDGVLRPHRIVTTVDGVPFAETSILSFELNPAFPSDAFEKPAG